jgi:hypothetical protein
MNPNMTGSYRTESESWSASLAQGWKVSAQLGNLENMLELAMWKCPTCSTVVL